MSDISSETILSDSFEDENTNSASSVTSNELSSGDNGLEVSVTPDNKSYNESTLIKTTKKKVNVITSDSENDQDISYGLFHRQLHPIGRSSVLPQTEEAGANMQTPEKSVKNTSAEVAEKSTALLNEDNKLKVSQDIIDASENDIVEVSSDEVSEENNFECR
ncbi:uncharacterized protein LOC108737473 [Agrilus planipennis]|uniref:Uncharacterized protein LOC108737473 n=1 Tax=Agrilus planipennis TaxID=224129 RepID=A0A1W4WZ94_AGRPL|nr:uncharacterized protein LOC108737473 [Agrilus planipennis]